MARKRKQAEPSPETIAPTAGPGDVPWLSEQISSVGTWHRKTAANVKQLSTALKTAKAEHKEASNQLSRLAVELANARGEYDPEEIEAEQKDRPLLKACGVHGEKPPKASQESAAELPPVPAGDWRNDILSNVLKSFLDVPTAVAAWDAFAGRIGLDETAYIDMNVVCTWFADRPRGDQFKIVDLDLDDARKVAFLDALAAWRSARLQHAGAKYPEGFPIEFVTPEFHGLKEIVKKVRHRARAKASKAKKVATS